MHESRTGLVANNLAVLDDSLASVARLGRSGSLNSVNEGGGMG